MAHIYVLIQEIFMILFIIMWNTKVNYYTNNITKHVWLLKTTLPIVFDSFVHNFQDCEQYFIIVVYLLIDISWHKFQYKSSKMIFFDMNVIFYARFIEMFKYKR